MTEQLTLRLPADRSRAAQETCVDFFLRGVVIMVPTALESQSRIKVLMGRYHSVPMDYADATLVALAEVLSTGSILTLDRRDFGVYRWSDRKHFDISP